MVNILSYVAVLLFILLVVSLCIDENSNLVVLLTSMLCVVVVVIVGYKMYDGYTYLKTARGITEEVVDRQDVDLTYIKINSISEYQDLKSIEYLYLDDGKVHKSSYYGELDIVEYDGEDIKLEFIKKESRKYKCYGNLSDSECSLAYEEYLDDSFSILNIIRLVLPLPKGNIGSVKVNTENTNTLYIPRGYSISNLYKGVDIP